MGEEMWWRVVPTENHKGRGKAVRLRRLSRWTPTTSYACLESGLLRIHFHKALLLVMYHVSGLVERGLWVCSTATLSNSLVKQSYLAPGREPRCFEANMG